ncbi:MAG: hypothetical protein PWQ82_1283 [Thermosediminibacterales bacterium]|nr:hypothetical protein [Thermosediminibacterales bacterium]MDK2836614.1 hypothetical protein [Thermosediminibacterales bacterium]
MPPRRKIKLSEAAAQALKNKPENNQPPLPPKQPPFEQRYHRITTYLEKEIHQKIKELKTSNKISSITVLINIALKEFIDRYY